MSQPQPLLSGGPQESSTLTDAVADRLETTHQAQPPVSVQKTQSYEEPSGRQTRATQEKLVGSSQTHPEAEPSEKSPTSAGPAESTEGTKTGLVAESAGAFQSSPNAEVSGGSHNSPPPAELLGTFDKSSQSFQKSPPQAETGSLKNAPQAEQSGSMQKSSPESTPPAGSPCNPPQSDSKDIGDASSALSPGELRELLGDSSLKQFEDDKLDSSGEIDMDAMIPLSARDRTTARRTLPASAASTATRGAAKPSGSPVAASEKAGVKTRAAAASPAITEPTAGDLSAEVVSQPQAPPPSKVAELKKAAAEDDKSLAALEGSDQFGSASANSFFTFGERSPTHGRNSSASGGSPAKASSSAVPKASEGHAEKDQMDALARERADKARAAELAEILGADSDDDDIPLFLGRKAAPGAAPSQTKPSPTESRPSPSESTADKARAAELAEILGADSDDDDIPLFLGRKPATGAAPSQTKPSPTESRPSPSESIATELRDSPVAPNPFKAKSAPAVGLPTGGKSKTQLAQDLGLDDSDDSDGQLRSSPKGISGTPSSDAGSALAASPSAKAKQRANPLGGRGRGRGGGLWQSSNTDSFIGPGGGAGSLGAGGGSGLGIGGGVAKALAMSKGARGGQARPGIPGLRPNAGAKSGAKPGGSLFGGPIDWSQAADPAW